MQGFSRTRMLQIVVITHFIDLKLVLPTYASLYSLYDFADNVFELVLFLYTSVLFVFFVRTCIFFFTFFPCIHILFLP